MASIPAGPSEDKVVRVIGEWLLDARGNELRRGSEVVRLERKAIEVLVCLAARPGEVLTREELLERVWPGVVVGDDTLTQAVIKLRRALGDEARDPRYIDTIPKRGYRLIAPVDDKVEDASGRDAVASIPPSAPPSPPPVLRRIRPWWARAGRAALVVVPVAAIASAAWLAAGTSGRWPAATDRWPAAAVSGTSVPIVALLPLTHADGRADREYFSGGLTEDLINALGRFSGLRVMSRGAVQEYAGRTASPMEIRRDLGAHYVVQGTLREADGRVRLTVALSDTRSGTLLGSETYDGAGLELFDIQDRIVRQVVARLHLKLTQAEQQRALTKPTGSLESYDLLLRARILVARSDRASNMQARALLARALGLDPRYDDARTTLGEAEFQRAARGWVEDAAGSVRRAEHLAREVLASVDPRAHARAHALLAMILNHRGQYPLAASHADQAIALNPSDPVALYHRAASALSMGRVDESIWLHETGRRFEPRPLSGERLNLGIAQYSAGRYAAALAEADAVLTAVPGHAHAQALKAAALARSGKVEEARSAAEEVKRLDPLFDADSFGTRFEDPRYTAFLRDGLRAAGL